MLRWLKFNAVGAIGVAVQLGVLAVLIQLGVHYLFATALAVEAAVLQNYYWHTRWTWKGREGSLWRFHVANGLLSLISNLMWMHVHWLAGNPATTGELDGDRADVHCEFFAGRPLGICAFLNLIGLNRETNGMAGHKRCRNRLVQSLFSVGYSSRLAVMPNNRNRFASETQREGGAAKSASAAW